MYEHHLQLFSKKDMYIMSCSDSGMNRVMMSLTTAKRRKLKTGNLHLTKGMKFTQTNGFPILDAYTGPTDFTSYPYTMHHKLDGKNQALHFFLDDYKFEEATGKKLEQTTYRLARFDYLFTPDYSLYVDAPIHFNKDNIFKSRFAGAYWQNCGFHIIPTVSWGNVNSFVYAFEGLPQQSVLATCGVGYQHCHASKTLWEYAIQRIEAELSPIELIIYGKPTDIPGIHTPHQVYTRLHLNTFKKMNTTKNNLWPEDKQLLATMADKYYSENEKQFFEKMKLKMEYEFAPSNDLIMFEEDNEDHIYIVRVYYDEFIIGHGVRGNYDEECHVMNLSEALNVNLKAMRFINRDMCLLDWLRERDYQGIRYNHNYALM